jgi:hypothetical protein
MATDVTLLPPTFTPVIILNLKFAFEMKRKEVNKLTIQFLHRSSRVTRISV